MLAAAGYLIKDATDGEIVTSTSKSIKAAKQFLYLFQCLQLAQ